jgi:hypothetical protein
MSLTIDRDGASTRADEQRRWRHGGPVVLATLEHAPFEAAAARVAVEAAAEMRVPLLMAHVLETKRGRRRRGRADESPPPALTDSVRAAKAHAAELGVELEALRLSGRRAVASLLWFVADRRPVLVVLATDPASLRRFRRPTRQRYRQVVAALSGRSDSLLWTAQAPGAAAASAASRSQRRSAQWNSPEMVRLRASMSGGQVAAANGRAA